MKSSRPFRPLAVLIAVTAAVAGCAAPGEKPVDGEDAPVNSTQTGVSCSESQNLLVDTRFQNLGQGSWAYVQHSGPQSFSFTSEQGELELARTGDEPWMLLTQQVALPALDPDKRHTLVLSAELKGDVPTEPELHGFEHKAGLFMRSGAPSMAEHEPNNGVWDWQRIDVSEAVLSGKTRVQAGFLHQGGGTLWARDPSLKLVACDD